MGGSRLPHTSAGARQTRRCARPAGPVLCPIPVLGTGVAFGVAGVRLSHPQGWGWGLVMMLHQLLGLPWCFQLPRERQKAREKNNNNKKKNTKKSKF